jgi:formylglycine-generating enzyme required for sulfatase activity
MIAARCLKRVVTLKNELPAGHELADSANVDCGDSGQKLERQKEELQALVSQQAEQLESLGAERNSLLSISSSLQEEVEQLRHALSQAAVSADDDFASVDDGIENIVIESIDPEVPAGELEAIRHERDEMRQQQQRHAESDAELREIIASLQEQLKSTEKTAEEKIATVTKALEVESQRLAVLEVESAARNAQLESSRVESSQKDVDLDILRDELEVARQQVTDLQLLVERGDERAKSLEDDYEDSARKSHEDLKRKNDIEKEMQGQIDRLRKQLEQTSRDFQKSRVSAQEDLDNLRDELHAERQARAEERAQMAARQRELKEQLAAVASEHEVNFSKQSDVIEEAVDAVRIEERNRLQGVLDAHAATEDQLAKVQQDLQQAHAEMVVFRHQERERHQTDIKLMDEQYRQAETAIKQLESQLKQLTRERDSALEEQNGLREKINTLRGEVEIARGLMNVAGPGQLEDPARLRKQLEETRKNVEIAVRLRAEAEAARDRLINERNALLAQLENSQGAGESLYIPSLDEGMATNERSMAQHASPHVNAGKTDHARAGMTHTDVADDVKSGRRFPGWLGGVIGLLVAGAVALGGWLFVSSEQSDSDTLVTGQVIGLQTMPANDNTPVNAERRAEQLPAAPPAGQMAELSPLPVVPESGEQPMQLAASVEAEKQPAAWLPVAEVPSPAQEAPVEKVGAAVYGSDLFAKTVSVAETVPPKSARTARQPVNSTFADALKIGGDGPVMVELAVAGYFMGSYGNSLNYEEGPRHLVKLPGFSIGKYEVTFAEYDRFARATGRRLPYDETWGRGDQPVINVSWRDAQDYVDWLTAQTGHIYRLPSEAEWEYAVRGGSYWMYWWMDAEDAVVTDEVWANCHNCGSQWDSARTAPIGQFPANAFGLYDMTGNVQEWTADCYHESYDGAPNDGSAWVRPHCTQRVVRGGGYTSPLDTLRSAKRGQLDQDTRLDNLGFRVVREN